MPPDTISDFTKQWSVLIAMLEERLDPTLHDVIEHFRQVVSEMRGVDRFEERIYQIALGILEQE